jgi:chromatin remodeling complex protein RSC6
MPTKKGSSDKKDKVEKVDKKKESKKEEKKVEKPKEEVKNDEVSERSKLEQLFDGIINIEKSIKELKNLYKIVQKEDEKKEKILKKERERKEKARASPSGFAKPTDISDEMCDFLKIAHGTQMSRTEVTKNINTYVSTNNLKDPVNGRIIRPDAVLKKLLRVSDDDEITFFHMQKLLNPHIKPFRDSNFHNPKSDKK